MSEPGADATDAELADYYDQHGEMDEWNEPEPVAKPDRLDVTISVRFTAAEIADIRARAEAANLKPTTYIRRCALAADTQPIDRVRLKRMLVALSNDLDDLKRVAS